METIDFYDTYPSSHTEAVFTAAILQRPEWAARAAAAGASAEWVLSPDYAAVVRAAFDDFRRLGAFTIDTVLATLNEREEIGPHVIRAERLVDLSVQWVDEASFEDALYRLGDGARLRRLWKALDDLRGRVFESGAVSLRERTDRMEAGLGNLVSYAAGQPDTFFDAARLSELALTKSEFVPTGIYSLDEAIRGYVPGRVTVLAGRPSHGKTALGLELALRMARRLSPEEGQVIYFSAEMSAQAVAHRLIANLSGVNSRDIMDQTYRVADGPRAIEASRSLAQVPLVIDEAAGPTTTYFLGRCLALQAQAPVRLVIFDYLQYTGEHAENRRLSLESALRGLHETARRLGCPVLCLAQLSREIDKRGGNPEPQLSDLKETGALEEVPSLVLMCHHPWTHARQMARSRSERDEIDPSEFCLYVRKNTHGPLGKITLAFDRFTGRFTDPDEPIL